MCEATEALRIDGAGHQSIFFTTGGCHEPSMIGSLPQ
jgi:hypothetical protein